MGAFKDLTGQTFGELTVLHKDRDKPRHWICRCSCNKIKSIHGYSLTSGKTKSCGHNTTSFKDITGQQFNEWTAMYYVGNCYWHCRCSCGVERDIYRKYLEEGISKSCGHDKIDKTYNQLIGKQFGLLTVIRYIGNKQYLCRCKCGEYTKVFKSNLISGGTKSCGCECHKQLSKEYIIKGINDYTETMGEKPTLQDVCDILELGITRTRKYIKEYNLYTYINTTYGSIFEKEVTEYIKDIAPNLKIELHNRKVLNGVELDIYIPEKSIAIEVNGTYWHSTEFKEETYHQKKTLLAYKNDITLIHIFEHEWLNSDMQRKIKNILKNILIPIQSNNDNIKINHIDSDLSKQFIEDNSIEYNIIEYNGISDTSIGLYVDDKLKCVATVNIIDKSQRIYEINNICYLNNNINIVQAKKIIDYFIEKEKASKILLNINITKFSINIYTELGFRIIKILKPNSYIVTYDKHSINRDVDVTALENKYRVYDAGNMILEKII